MKHSLFVLLIIPIFVLSSCSRMECENNNPVFDQFSIDSEEYKTELLKQIDLHGNNIKYWFDRYAEENGKEYIIVRIRNNSICARGMLHVKDWNKIEGIRKTKGMGYRGAKLKGLTFIAEKDSMRTELVFKGLNRIID